MKRKHRFCFLFQCFNSSNLLNVFGSGLPYVSEDSFEQISTMLLYYTSNLASFCHADIEIEDMMEYKNKRAELMNIFSGGNSGFLNIEKIQDSLEDLEDFYEDLMEKDSKEDSHDHDDSHEHDDNGPSLSLEDLLGDNFADDIMFGTDDSHHHDHDHGHSHEHSRKKRGGGSDESKDGPLETSKGIQIISFYFNVLCIIFILYTDYEGNFGKY